MELLNSPTGNQVTKCCSVRTTMAACFLRAKQLTVSDSDSSLIFLHFILVEGEEGK
jgi:hypothetical protein